ncbi:MarR family transcriptional regulator [Streptomyces spinosirectus]|uniref:MarR family winged helix-turn-helix transcriptional regulator n=1 Tax=Streptomyces TaxID=1883 RepID=UPI001F2E0BBB|nr:MULTISPECIES: MarR family transcriptional regulator [Streptomyces]UIR21852.1 MarR family transcriptional regulator [Streptomyces spinosirectus]
MHKRVMEPADAQAPPDEDTQASPEALMIAVEQLVLYVRRSATTGGLSTAASSVLGFLGREGACRLTDLARTQRVSQPNMTQLVTRLERAGLVRRTADSRDGRGVLVEATDAGMEVFRQRRTERTQALQEVVGRLSGPEQDAVRTALPALARAIHDLD